MERVSRWVSVAGESHGARNRMSGTPVPGFTQVSERERRWQPSFAGRADRPSRNAPASGSVGRS